MKVGRARGGQAAPFPDRLREVEDMGQPNESLAMIVNDPAYDRVMFALGMASAQRILQKNVNVLFTYGAIVRLKRGCTDDVGDETNPWVRGHIKAALGSGAMPPVSELLSDFRKLGGRIYACPAAMSLHDIVSEDLVDDVAVVRGLVAFLTELQSDQTQIIYI